MQRFVQCPVRLRLFGTACWLVVLAGCGSSIDQLEQNDPARIRMQALAIQYSRFMYLNGGKLPPSEAELKKFLQTRGKSFLAERGITNVDDLFVSPRDNQPLVISYGTQKMVRGFKPDPIVAHEQTGIDGKRLVAFPSGAVVDLDPEMFSKLQLAKDIDNTPQDTGGAVVEP